MPIHMHKQMLALTYMCLYICISTTHHLHTCRLHICTCIVTHVSSTHMHIHMHCHHTTAIKHVYKHHTYTQADAPKFVNIYMPTYMCGAYVYVWCRCPKIREICMYIYIYNAHTHVYHAYVYASLKNDKFKISCL